MLGASEAALAGVVASLGVHTMSLVASSRELAMRALVVVDLRVLAVLAVSVVHGLHAVHLSVPAPAIVHLRALAAVRPERALAHRQVGCPVPVVLEGLPHVALRGHASRVVVEVLLAISKVLVVTLILRAIEVTGAWPPSLIIELLRLVRPLIHTVLTINVLILTSVEGMRIPASIILTSAAIWLRTSTI